MNSLLRALIPGALILCAVPGRSAADPVPPPGAFSGAQAAGSSEAPPGSLTLAQADAIALRNHPRVAIADLRRRIADETLAVQRSAYYPTAAAYLNAVDVGNENTRILAGGLNNPSIYDRVADGVAINEVITDFGRTRNLVAGARLEAHARREDTAAAIQEILLSVHTAYFKALEAQTILEVARETVATRQTVLDQIQSLARNQLKSELDVSFAQVTLEQGRLILQSAENDAAGSLATLADALGYREAPDRFELAGAPAAGAADGAGNLGAYVEEAMTSRPDLLRARDDRDAAARRTLAERDRNLPTIDAVATTGNAITHDDHLPNRYAAAGLAVTLPLFDGGSDLARLREARLEAEAADQQLRELENAAGRDVRIAWLNYQTALDRRRTTADLLKNANRSFDLARARYAAGSGSIVELNEAQLNATAARIEDAQARYDSLIRQSVLEYQAGNLRPAG